MKKINFSLSKVSLFLFLGVAAVSIRANADIVALTGSGNGLYNTGVEVDDLTPIPPDNTGIANPADPAYSVSYYADGSGGLPPTIPPPTTLTPGYYGTPTSTGTAYVAAPLSTDPNFSGHDWAGNPTNAQWITYTPSKSTDNATPFTAVTVYELVLTDIPTGDQVTISGQIAGDDNVSVYANGQQLFSDFGLADNGTSNDSNYNQLNALGLSFLSGATNTLDFVVYNTGGYTTSLLADLAGYYSTSDAPVPEPSTYALFVGGLGLLVFLARRKTLARI